MGKETSLCCQVKKTIIPKIIKVEQITTENIKHV